MVSVLFVLSLLVFGAGLVAWAVHMHGVWTREPRRTDVRQGPAEAASFTREPAAPPTPPPSVIDPFAHVGEPGLKDAQP